MNTSPSAAAPAAAIRPLFWRVREAADQLSISRSQLYRLIDAGEIRTSNVGPGAVRIADVELQAYAKRQRQLQQGG